MSTTVLGKKFYCIKDDKGVFLGADSYENMFLREQKFKRKTSSYEDILFLTSVSVLGETMLRMMDLVLENKVEGGH